MKKNYPSEEFNSLYQKFKRKQRLVALTGLLCCSSLAMQAGILEAQVNLAITNTSLKNALELVGTKANVSITIVR